MKCYNIDENGDKEILAIKDEYATGCPCPYEFEEDKKQLNSTELRR